MSETQKKYRKIVPRELLVDAAIKATTRRAVTEVAGYCINENVPKDIRNGILKSLDSLNSMALHHVPEELDDIFKGKIWRRGYDRTRKYPKGKSND